MSNDCAWITIASRPEASRNSTNALVELRALLAIRNGTGLHVTAAVRRAFGVDAAIPGVVTARWYVASKGVGLTDVLSALVAVPARAQAWDYGAVHLRRCTTSDNWT